MNAKTLSNVAGRMGSLALSKGDRAAAAYLYGPPSVPLTNVVTTTSDVGAGSLRAALYYATDHPGTSWNNIEGNYIGLAADGVSALSNSWEGITILNGAQSNVIGLKTDGSGAANRIAFNGLEGIRIDGANTVGNTVRGNAIYTNGALGIDLVGANHLQTFPAFTSASVFGGLTILSGSFNSTPGHQFVLDFYRNTAADPSGYGEGQFYLGGAAAATDAGGNAIFGFAVTGSYTGQYFTATATDLGTGDTGEFNQAMLATVGGGPPVFLKPFSASGSGFAAQLTLNLGQSYHIQAATNLSMTPIAWITLTNFLAGNSPVQFTDPSATNHRSRFYRVASP